jgi:hypothetical protein
MFNPVLTFAAASLVLTLGASRALDSRPAFGRNTADLTVTFDHDKPGAPPTGFTFSAMRQAAPGSWVVERQGTQQFLVHGADTTANGFSLAINGTVLPGAFTLSAKVRTVGGGRVGGLVWHYQDESNYYALTLDLGRRQVSLYRVAAGNRIRLEFEDDLELDPEAWHAIKVIHGGHSTRVLLGGIRVFEHDDRRHETQTDGGRAGLLAAGNSTVHYDDLHVVESSDRGR